MTTAEQTGTGAPYRPASDLPLEPEMHPLVQNNHDLTSVGNAIGSVVFRDSHPKGWWFGFLAGLAAASVLLNWRFYRLVKQRASTGRRP